MCRCHLALTPGHCFAALGTLVPRLLHPDPGWSTLQAEETEKRKAQEKAKKEIAELMVKAQSEAKASEEAPNKEEAEKAETLSEELRQKVPLSAGMTLEAELTWGWLEGGCWGTCQGCCSAGIPCLLVISRLRPSFLVLAGELLTSCWLRSGGRLMQAASDVMADAYCLFGCRPSRNRLRQASRVTQQRPLPLSRTMSGQPRSRRHKRLPLPVRVGRMSATQASSRRPPYSLLPANKPALPLCCKPHTCMGQGWWFSA